MTRIEAIRRAARLRSTAVAVILQCEALQERMRKAVPGIEEWSCDDGPVGASWVGIGQAKVYAEHINNTPMEALAAVLMERCK